MKLTDARKEAYRMMGMSSGYDGPVVLPSHLSPECHPERDRLFLIEMGRLCLCLLNRRKSQ